MKILIVGFQRSGTTLLRRILQSHPDVKQVFHEKFLLKKFKTKKALLNHVLVQGVTSPKRHNWGEKVPFYPGIRGMSVKTYCEKWIKYFGKQSRILHIVRHPIDVGRSINKKYKGQKVITGIRTYKRVMPNIIPILNDMPYCYTFKYEDMLLNPERRIAQIVKFCDLPEFDWKSKLAQIANPRYRQIDPSRAFAHRSDGVESRKDLTKIIDILNRIPGPKY